MTLALGFATRGTPALDAATESLDDGFEAVANAYKAGWIEYRNQLKPIPAAALPVAATYETSLLVLKAHEDKDNPGAFVASPSMPWGWGELTIDEDNPRSGPYHLVWPRDLYQVATALHAAGDTDGANARARLRVRQAAARGRLVPAEHAGRRAPEVDVDADGPGRPADRARLAARPRPAEGLAPRPRRRRLHRRPRPEERAGALGEPGGLLARDDRRRDRRPDLRRRHRAPQRRHEARRRPTSARRTPGSATSSAGRRPPTAPTRPSRTTCASPRTASRTRARPTRSATPARRRWTSGAWSTSPSWSSSGSASSAPTTAAIVNTLQVVDSQARRRLVLAPLLVRRLRRAPQRQVVASVR